MLFSSLSIQDNFWAPKIKVNHEVTLPIAYEQSQKTGRIDNLKIATENISGKADGKFIDVQYNIPEELTVSNNEVTVKFAPHEGHRSGPFFYARTIKR